MNGTQSPVFDEKKPSLLRAAGGSMSACKDSPTLPESSSTDMGFYSGQSALLQPQDTYAPQQPYAAPPGSAYTYHPHPHHYSLSGTLPGASYPVGKAEYPFHPHAAYREPAAFSREPPQDAGERS